MDDEWKPPSPAEMRELEEKRRRSDEMSAKMSDMLLRGWKMLNEYCPETGDVPLMQNREGRKYSVALEKFIDEIETVLKTREGGAHQSNGVMQSLQVCVCCALICVVR